MDGPTHLKPNGAGKAPSEARRSGESTSESIGIIIETFLGDTSLTLAELNGLRKGQVLPLGASLSDPVELRVNGRCIGRGELVAVGDQFGVRISEII